MPRTEAGPVYGGSVHAAQRAVHAGHAGRHPPELQTAAGRLQEEASG